MTSKAPLSASLAERLVAASPPDKPPSEAPRKPPHTPPPAAASPPASPPDRGFVEQPGEDDDDEALALLQRARRVISGQEKPKPVADETKRLDYDDDDKPTWEPHRTMPKRQRKTYSPEFIRDAVQQVLDDPNPRGAAARVGKKLKVHQTVVSEWLRKAREGKAVDGRKKGAAPVSAANGAPAKAAASNGAAGLQIHVTGLEDLVRAEVERQLPGAIRRILGGGG